MTRIFFNLFIAFFIVIFGTVKDKTEMCQLNKCICRQNDSAVFGLKKLEKMLCLWV